MGLEITNWNTDPNIDWFVRLFDNGSDINVDLYSTEADALAETNLIAYSTAVYGINSEVKLTGTGSSFTDSISYFNYSVEYHLMVSGTLGDPTKIYKVAAFVDITAITNNIYRSDELVAIKTLSEINKHTHLSKIKTIDVANHNPDFAVGDVVNINTTVLGISALASIEEVTIVGTKDVLFNQIQTVEYGDTNYGT